MNDLYNISTENEVQEQFAGWHYPERHGFVTFWLWFGIICSIVSCVTGCMTASSISNLGEYGMQLIVYGYDITNVVGLLQKASNIMMTTTIIGSICTIIGYAMLLKWKKAGFWLMIIASVIIFGVDFYALSVMSDAYTEIGLSVDYKSLIVKSILITLVSWGLLWAILHIKKDGVSCWSQLE